MVGIFDAAMSTRNEIIRVGDELIRDKGFNAFSFYNISRELGIRNASIHYHFPTKADLGLAIVDKHIADLEELIERVEGKPPMDQLRAYLSIYSCARAEGRICVVGALGGDINTIDTQIRARLEVLAHKILVWVTAIMKEGRAQGVFSFASSPRSKAMTVISCMLASLQLSRLTGGERDFDTIKDTIVKELKA